MSLGERNGFDWDGLGPAAAAAALVVLALLPQRPSSAVVDPADRFAALEAAPAGQAVPWKDRSSGRTGQLIPEAVFRADNGLWCRSYKISYSSGGRLAADRLACRSTDGRWRDFADDDGAHVAAKHADGQVATLPER